MMLGIFYSRGHDVRNCSLLSSAIIKIFELKCSFKFAIIVMNENKIRIRGYPSKQCV
jgi:hypothetical protein